MRFRYLGARPVFDETSPEYQYFTAKTWDGRPNPDYDPSRVIAQSWFIVDLYAAYRWRFVEVGLSVQNLLNSTWRESQLGNRSCTFDETYNPANPYYAGSGNKLSDGTFANRCGIGFAQANGVNTRSGVVDVHYTPGVPFNPQLTVRLFFDYRELAFAVRVLLDYVVNDSCRLSAVLFGTQPAYASPFEVTIWVGRRFGFM